MHDPILKIGVRAESSRVGAGSPLPNLPNERLLFGFSYQVLLDNGQDWDCLAHGLSVLLVRRR